MELTNTHQKIEPAAAGWQSLYRIAGVGALLAVSLMLLDIGLSFTGGDLAVGGSGAVEWFDHFQQNAFLGLRNLGLFNVLNTLLVLPLYLVIYRLHRDSAPVGATLMVIVFLLGTAVYDANNRALSMLALSNQYASATSEAQRALLATAGTVILAQAEDFTPGTFLGFFLSNLASIAMMGLLLRGHVFAKWMGLIGLVGSSCLLCFTVSVTFIPSSFDLAMNLAMIGGLLMIAWHIGMALGLFRLGSASQNLPADQAGARRGALLG